MSGDALPASSYGMALRFGVGLFVAGGLSRGRKCAKRRFILAFSVGDTVRHGRPGSGGGLGAVYVWFMPVGVINKEREESTKHIYIYLNKALTYQR